MQVKDIMQALEKLAPQQLKEDWDNVGLQLGDPNAEVRRVLLALTPSLAVTKEAVFCAHQPRYCARRCQRCAR